MSGRAGTLAPTEVTPDELDGQHALDGMPAPVEPERDEAPAKPSRRSRSRAPRAPRTKAAADRKPRAPRTRKPALGARMANLYTMAGVGVSMAPHPAARAVGLAMAANATECGQAWEALAKENPAVARALEQLLTVSTVGALLAAHTPIVLAGLSAAGKVPAGMATVLTFPTPAPAQAEAEPEHTTP